MKLPSSSATNLNKENLRHMISMKDFTREEMDKMMDLMTLLKNARKDKIILLAPMDQVCPIVG